MSARDDLRRSHITDKPPPEGALLIDDITEGTLAWHIYGRREEGDNRPEVRSSTRFLTHPEPTGNLPSLGPFAWVATLYSGGFIGVSYRSLADMGTLPYPTGWNVQFLRPRSPDEDPRP